MQPPNLQSRKKKLLAIMPFMALPFCCLLFYALGGGKTQTAETPAGTGLNSQLPSPLEGQTTLDKMSLYNKVAQDSARAKDQEKNDPFSIFSTQSTDGPNTSQERGAVVSPFSPNDPTSTQFGYTSPERGNNSQQQLDDLERKLASIQQVMEAPAQTSAPAPPIIPADPNPELEKLASIMTTMKDSTGEDQEMAKMSGLLDKVLDIQHPQRVKERLKEISRNNQGKVYPVAAKPENATADYFGAVVLKADTARRIKPTDIEKNIFYDDRSVTVDNNDPNAAVQAVIHEKQLLVSGATVKIRLQQPVYIDGHLVDKGSFLFGHCSLSGERLMIEISSVRSGSALFPVQLTVFDLDGNAGIRIPGSITRDATKQSTDQAIQSLALSSMDPSIGAQAAAAGIETAKSLLGKKVRLIKVTVKSDYPILLQSAQ